MPLDGEPKDGDYVAYIEALVNRGTQAPGQVAPAARKRGRWTDTFRPAGATADAGEAAPWPASGNFTGPGAGEPAPAPNPATAPPAGPVPARRGRAATAGTDAAQPADAPRTLARAASQRKQGLVMLGLAALLAVVAVDMARDAMAVAGDFEEFMPCLFLLVFAFVFMRAGLAARRRSRMPVPPLPALSTVPSSARRRN